MPKGFTLSAEFIAQRELHRAGPVGDVRDGRRLVLKHRTGARPHAFTRLLEDGGGISLPEPSHGGPACDPLKAHRR